MTGSCVVVLGGTGFIGSHLLDRLAQPGRPLRAASRRGTWPWPDPRPAAEIIALDLAAGDSEAGLHDLLARADLIYNLSGALQRPGTPDSLYRDLHVHGTARLLAALRQQRPRQGRVRLVHVSTTGVLGPTGPQAREEDAAGRPATIYERTKAEGERLALAAGDAGLEVTVARPGLVYGPRDLHLLGLFRAIADGRFRLIAGGRACWQPVHVADVVDGLVRLGEADGVEGRTFHLAGSQALTVAAFAGAIATALGTRLRGPSLPRPLAWLAGATLEAACLPLGLEPPLSRMRVRTLTQDRRYRIDRARRRLGWSPAVPLADGLRETVAWYRAHGHLAEAA